MLVKKSKNQKRPHLKKNALPQKQTNTKNYNEASNQYETKKLHPLNLYLNYKNVLKN